MIRKTLTVTIAAALGLFASAGVAMAHVTAGADTTAAGSYALVNFKVPHGCDGKGTTSIEIKLEDDFLSVTPFESTGWTVKTAKRKLDKPVKGEYGEITEVADVVTYTRSAGPLPDGYGSVLPVSIQWPEDAAGKTLFFPVVQNCEGGLKTSWVNKAAKGEDPESIEDPAPSVTITEASADGHHGGSMAMSDDDHGDDEGDDDSKSANDDKYPTHDHVHKEVGTARTMAFIGIVLGALGLIMALLGFRGRSKENRS